MRCRFTPGPIYPGSLDLSLRFALDRFEIVRSPQWSFVRLACKILSAPNEGTQKHSLTNGCAIILALKALQKVLLGTATYEQVDTDSSLGCVRLEGKLALTLSTFPGHLDCSESSRAMRVGTFVWSNEYPTFKVKIGHLELASIR